MKYFAKAIGKQLIEDSCFAWHQWQLSQQVADRVPGDVEFARNKLSLLLDALVLEVYGDADINAWNLTEQVGGFFVSICLTIKAQRLQQLVSVIDQSAQIIDVQTQWQVSREWLSVFDWLVGQEVDGVLDSMWRQRIDWLDAVVLLAHSNKGVALKRDGFQHLFESQNILVQAYVLQLIADQKMHPCKDVVANALAKIQIPQYVELLNELDEVHQFYNWQLVRAIIRLNLTNYFGVVQQFSLARTPWQREAIILLYGWMPSPQSYNYLSKHIEHSGLANLPVLMSVAALGAPEFIGPLFTLMDDPILAPCAVQVIACITGQDLDPYLADSVELMDISLEDERYLEWMWGYGGMAMPKLEALRSWWTTYSQQLQAGSRYTMGLPLGANEETFEIMQSGTHTQRKILESLAVRAI